MSVAQTTRLQVPDSLRNQLMGFRRRVWVIKLIEATSVAVFGVLIGFFAVFLLDRFLETPVWVRGITLAVAIAACAMVPLYLHRWVWRHRRIEQLAKLVGQRMPLFGDELLGVLELVGSDAEQARSPALCQAAMAQVAESSSRKNLLDASPASRYRTWAGVGIAGLAGAAFLALAYPTATANAWARFVSPWSATPRYTFTQLEAVPESLIVAHGEPVTFSIALQQDSPSRPGSGILEVGRQRPIKAVLKDGRYTFAIPPQIEPQRIKLKIGDAVEKATLEPTLRPGLQSMLAHVQLPDYLQQPQPIEKDVRGGTISVVKGSRARFSATANRALAKAEVNGSEIVPRGERVTTQPTLVSDSAQLEFAWEDVLGLGSRDPFSLTINALDDEAPTLICEGLPRRGVVLDAEMLKFQVRVNDDFGIRQVGLEWRPWDAGQNDGQALGERPLAAGDPEKTAMELAGTFSAKLFGIAPQPIELFVWAEDFLPNRQRVYSPPHVLFVLTPDEHAIWMAEQLSKWHRQSLEVRDRELQLYETNKELRALPPGELDQPATRREIERQAAAERSNGRRLSKLTEAGGELLRQAARNPEIGVGHLDRWAEMLQILNDISAQRMPSVADLLKETAESPQLAGANQRPGNQGPKAGQNRATGSAKSEESEDLAAEAGSPAKVPQVVDMESSQQPPNPGATSKPPSNKTKQPSLHLAQTTLMGPGKKDTGQQKPQTPAEEKLDEAVEEQKDLLAEFEKIADELNTILANLEGSTLVKRLKAQSRQQNEIATALNEQMEASFGLNLVRTDLAAQETFNAVSAKEAESVQTVSYIMDDMQAYFERRRFAQFKNVLDDMRKEDVLGGLRELSDDIPSQRGLSMAQCEYWSDTMDRWAEDLVDPACSGQCPGSKSKGSLPPSIVLEVLQVLEAEVNLREETRVAEQAKAAQQANDHRTEARRLSADQIELRIRITNVIERILELPDAEAAFGKDLAILRAVVPVMNDAAEILATPDTGSLAIAAETEAIELLLQSKRINPGGGGGGGSTPGGGGGGTTSQLAATLSGAGTNDKEVRKDHGVTQSTGNSGPLLPEEFRAGLDQYFNELERIRTE